MQDNYICVYKHFEAYFVFLLIASFHWIYFRPASTSQTFLFGGRWSERRRALRHLFRCLARQRKWLYKSSTPLIRPICHTEVDVTGDWSLVFVCDVWVDAVCVCKIAHDFRMLLCYVFFLAAFIPECFNRIRRVQSKLKQNACLLSTFEILTNVFLVSGFGLCRRRSVLAVVCGWWAHFGT